MIRPSLERMFFPPFCLVCGGRDDNYFCRRCRRGITKRSSPFVLPAATSSGLKVWSWGEYQGGLRQVVEQLKYRNKKVLALELGQILAEEFLFLAGACDWLLPVPLHRDRLKSRGYNQSQLMAAEIARRWSKPVAPEIIIRRKATPPLFALSAADRQQTMAGSFCLSLAAARDWLVRLKRRPVRLLLLDDIITTGSTLSACADALKPCSEIEITGALTVARTVART